MNESIVGALVGAIATAVLGLIVWGLQKLINNTEKREIKKKQLDFVYSPLMAILEKNHILCSDLYIKLDEIIKLNHALVDKYLLKWHKSTDIMSEENCPEKLRLHIVSNYNWLKKKLGQKYDKNQIIPQYLMNYETKCVHIRIIKGVFIFMYWATLFIISIAYILYPEWKQTLLPIIMFLWGIFISYHLKDFFDKWN